MKCVMKCKKCGKPMVKKKDKNFDDFEYYVCSTVRFGSSWRSGCDYKFIPLDQCYKVTKC